MDKYIDKATVFVLCAVFYIQYHVDIYIVVPLICVIIISAFMSYMDVARVKIFSAIAFFAVCVYDF